MPTDHSSLLRLRDAVNSVTARGPAAAPPNCWRAQRADGHTVARDATLQGNLNRGASRRILAFSMKRKPTRQTPADCFERVKKAGLAFPDVEAITKYDGSPVLKVRGCFMAGLAMHRSAEPKTLVVRVGLEERAWLLEDAPDTYYVTDYYRPYPIVLVRLSHIDQDALHDLLSISWRLATAKARRP
jgi:hypothetical protein